MAVYGSFGNLAMRPVTFDDTAIQRTMVSLLNPKKHPSKRDFPRETFDQVGHLIQVPLN